MLIINCNNEALSYLKRQPGADTIFYFEFENNLNDTSGKGNNPTGSRGITYEQVNGQYVAKTTSNPYIQLNASLGNNITDFTISFWINVVAPSNGYYPMLFWAFNNNSPYAWPTIFYHDNNSNRVLVRMSSNNSKYPFNLTPGTWQYITFTRVNGTCKVYLNAVEMASRTDSQTWSTQSFYILSRPDANQYFNNTGTKADKYIFEKKGRNSDDITKYYNQTKNIYS